MLKKVSIILIIILIFSFSVFAQNVGDQAPDFNVRDWNGNSQSLAKYRGKVILLKFWASWCGPCRASFKSKTQYYYNKYGNNGLIIFAIGLGGKSSDKRFLENNNYQTHVNVDGKQYSRQIRSKYHFRGIPFEVLISKTGQILWKGHPYRLSDTLVKQALAGTATVKVEKRDAVKDFKYVLTAFKDIIKPSMRTGYFKGELRSSLLAEINKASSLRDLKSLLVNFSFYIKGDGYKSSWKRYNPSWQQKVRNADNAGKLISCFRELLFKGLSYRVVADRTVWRRHNRKVLKILRHFR